VSNVFLPIAPIFALIVLGHLLRRGGIPNVEFWNLNDKLVYWVLMPALLFYKVSQGLLDGAALRTPRARLPGASHRQAQCPWHNSGTVTQIHHLNQPARNAKPQGFLWG